MLQTHVAKKLNISENQLGKIKNIVFDLGGVIIDIHYNDTLEKFRQLGFDNFEEIYTQIKNTSLFDNLETGKIKPEAFRDELRKIKNHLSDEQIDEAWNSMIGEMPGRNLALLKSIRTKYRTFLLSNTNAIHIAYFRQYLQQTFGYDPLPEMFEHTWFSHEIGERKPTLAAYEYILKDGNLNPHETLFIDDLAVNIEGARKAGLLAYHLVDETIMDLF
jgi:glucose-1-phosphatase